MATDDFVCFTFVLFVLNLAWKMLSLTLMTIRKPLFLVASLWLVMVTGVSNARSATLIPTGATWSYWPGEEAPSLQAPFWVEANFSDANWQEGPAPFRYGDGEGGTLIEGMQNTYSTFFIRRSFQVATPDQIEALTLHIDYDDGFALWINGRRVRSANAPNAIQLDSLATGSHESGAFETFSLDAGIEHLVPGRNIVAIQGFNTTLGSSDFVLHPELVYEGLDAEAPVVIAVDPAPGLVEDFREVTVQFSEPVQGVEARDLTLNGVPAQSLSGRGDTWRFGFAPPEPGSLTLRWEQETGITDLARTPNPFDGQAASETRLYQLLDENAPHIIDIFPRPGQALSACSSVRLLFSEPIQGLDPGDLLLNGQTATSVVGTGAGPYQLFFAPSEEGEAQLTWSPQHGVEDLAAEPNALQPESWSYTVDARVRYQGVVISEILASNQNGLTDDDRERVDWIELHNINPFAVDLSGWSLSDDPNLPGKWVFDSNQIEPGGYLLVHASAKDRPNARLGGSPHTNFQLSRVGEFLGLFSPELPRQRVSDLGDRFPEQRMDFSYGRSSDGALGYFAEPTPGAPNTSNQLSEMLPEPGFSAPRGFYQGPVTLVLTTVVPEAQIRYTLDKSEPTASQGLVYDGPITLSRSTAVRAALFKPGFLPSETVTHSYMIDVSVRRQGLPVLSLVTDQENLFGRTGIMETSPRNTSKRGRAWERPVSVEYFLADGTSVFQIDAGLRIQGGNYVRDRYNPNGGLPFSKYSFRLYFRGDYGASELTYPLIPRSPATAYKQIVLRAGMNDHSNPFVVDELVRRLSGDMGQVSSQGMQVALYINGAYKGYYNPTERIDEDFLDTWQGGQGAYDIIAQFGEVREGNTVEWNRLKQALNRDLSIPSNYQAATEQIDIDAFIDYLLLNIYVGTRDWPHNNWRAARERVEGAKWRFYVWDAEWSFFNQGGAVNRNTLRNELAVNQDIARFYQALSKNGDFRTRFADRVHQHMFGDGALTDANILQRFEELRDELAPLKRINGNIATSWIPRRRGFVLDHLAQEGLFLHEDVPNFSQDPGSVPSGQLQLASAGDEIYYTLDGSDPFVPQAVSGDQQVLVGEQALKYAIVPTDDSLGFNWRSADRPFDPAGWSSGRGGVGYDESATYRTHIGIDLQSTMNDRNTSAYVRIPFNLRASDIEGVNLLNLKVKYDDGFAAYLNGRRIASANAPTTLRWNAAASADNPDSAAVSYQSFNVSDHLGRLREGSNVLAIHGLNRQLTSSDFLIDAMLEAGVMESGKVAEGAIRYQGPIAIDEVTNIRARSLQNGRWSALGAGVFYPGQLLPDLHFTEIMYHPPGGDAFEFVELSNLGPVALDLTRYQLRGVGYTFAVGATIPPGASWVLASNQRPGDFQRRYPDIPLYDTFSGSLSNGGESLVLEDASGAMVTGVRFGDDGAWPSSADGGGQSLERVDAQGPDNLPASWQASAQPGGSPGRFDPVSRAPGLVISEIMADNQSQADASGQFPDWVELENRGTTPISLAGYRLRDDSNAPDFEFTQGTLQPGQRQVLYQRDQGLAFGLDRDGDTLILIDPQGHRIDAVTFGSQWTDHSLSRDDDGTWTLGLPTPGAAHQSAPVAERSSLRLNEIMANPLPGEPDWLEWVNGHPNLPLALEGLHLRLNQALVALPPHSFLGPQQVRLMEADGSPNPSTLGVRLPAVGADLALLDVRGKVIDQLTYGLQEEGHSFGRLPHATGGFQSLGLQASPGQPNYLWQGPQLQLHEVMARHQRGVYPGMEGTPDWIELHNPTNARVDLGGVQIGVDGDRWALPEGAFIEAGAHRVLWLDGEDLVERSGFEGWVLPQALPGQGATLELLHPDGRLLDRLTYGIQLPDQSIGRVGGQWALLSRPTPGQANASAASLDSPESLRLNEWQGGAGADWLELYHPGSQPVALAGLSLTDDLSLAGRSKHPIAALSFIGPRSWVLFQADEQTEAGADHLGFRLSAQGENLGLYDTTGALIDQLALASTPLAGGSSGRLPDGETRVVSFLGEAASPDQPNARQVEGLRMEEVFTWPQEPFEMAVEVFNAQDRAFDLSGWSVGIASGSLDAYRLPANTVVPAKARHVLHQARWNPGADAPTLPGSWGWADRLYLSERDAQGQLTGQRLSLAMQPTAPGQSWGRWIAEDGQEHLAPMSEPTFGASTQGSLASFRNGKGAPNTGPWLGALGITEVMTPARLSSQALGQGNPVDDLAYVELVNRSDQAVALSRAQDRNQGWRLTGGIRMTFEGDLSLAPGQALLLVSFDPREATARWQQFQRIWQLPAGALVVGPYRGRLADRGESVRLETLVLVVDPSQPDQQRLAWMTADAVEDTSGSSLPDTSWGSLNRLALELPGEDRLQWIVAEPTPGWHGRARSILQGVLWSSRFITLQLATELDQALLIEYTDRLENPNWQELSRLTGNGEMMQVIDTDPSPLHRFYRVRTP